MTFRLVGSLPRSVVRELLSDQDQVEQRLDRITQATDRAQQAYRESRRSFARWDSALADNRRGPHWLGDPGVADMVADSLHYRDGQVYGLDAYCIMSNHVHLVCTPGEERDGQVYSLTGIMHSLKRYTAREANKLLARKGAFWQQESYDHFVRDEDELRRVVKYVLDNPVKARLVSAWEEWPWTYVRT